MLTSTAEVYIGLSVYYVYDLVLTSIALTII